MENSIRLYGKINSNGKAIYSGIERYKKLLENYPGKRIMFEAIVLKPNTIDHHVWYILKMIVPAFIEGHRQLGKLITPQEALDEIINTCPLFCKNRKGYLHKLFDWNKYKVDCDMPAEHLEIAIENLHLYALEHFNIVIGNTKFFKS